MADEETGYDQQNNVSTPSSSANDKIYEPKNKRKIIRLLTVFAYVFFVSLAAIMLSLYYVILWKPVPLKEQLKGPGVAVGLPKKLIQEETHYKDVVNKYYLKKEITEEEPYTTSSYKFEDGNVLPNKTLIQENDYTPTEVIMTGEPDTTSSYMSLVVQEATTSPNEDRIQGDPTPAHVQEDTVSPVEDHSSEEPLNEQLETSGNFTDRVSQLSTTLNPDDL